MASVRHPAGRDAPLPAWFGQGGRPERPHFDSAVFRGGGVGALTCAIRLARSSALRGRVVVLAAAQFEGRNGQSSEEDTTQYSSITDKTDESKRKEQIRAEVEVLVRRVVPDEIGE